MRRRKQRIGERAREYRGPRSKEGQGVRFEREGDCFAGGEERGVEWFAGLAFSWRFHSFPLLGRGGFGKIKNRTILKKIKKKVPKTNDFRNFFGAPAGIRTPDTLLKRQVLCLLSYWGGYISFSGIGRREATWLGWRDSNPLYRSQSPVCYHYTTSHFIN